MKYPKLAPDKKPRTKREFQKFKVIKRKVIRSNKKSERQKFNEDMRGFKE